MRCTQTGQEANPPYGLRGLRAGEILVLTRVGEEEFGLSLGFDDNCGIDRSAAVMDTWRCAVEFPILSPNDMSSTQCNWFSMPQCKRTAASICGAGASELLIK